MKLERKFLKHLMLGFNKILPNSRSCGCGTLRVKNCLLVNRPSHQWQKETLPKPV